MLNLSKKLYYKGKVTQAKLLYSLGYLININNFSYYEEGISFLGKTFIEKLVRISKRINILHIENKVQSLISLYNEAKIAVKQGRVAVCISGEPRTYKACYKSLDFFLGNYEIDYYIHCWTDQYTNELIKLYPGAKVIVEDRPDFYDLELLGLKELGAKDFGKGIKVPYANPNLYPMWYSIKRAFMLINESGKSPDDYKYIIRTRFDNFFPKRLNIEPIASNTIYVDPNYAGYGGYGDQLAIGVPAAMEKYSCLYDWLGDSFKHDFNGLKYHPETLVKVYLEDVCKLRIQPVAIDMRLLREDFIGLPPHEIPLRSHSTSKTRNKYLSDYVKNKFPDLISKDY